MRHNGVAVFVRNDQLHAGMPMIAAGALEPARAVAAENVAMLAESVRQGYTIVASEPSAVLALTHEYPMILDNDEDAIAVSRHTQEACHYLWQLHLRGRLKLNFQPQRISVGYHVPCHSAGTGRRCPGRKPVAARPRFAAASGRAGLGALQTRLLDLHRGNRGQCPDRTLGCRRRSTQPRRRRRRPRQLPGREVRLLGQLHPRCSARKSTRARSNRVVRPPRRTSASPAKNARPVPRAPPPAPSTARSFRGSLRSWAGISKAAPKRDSSSPLTAPTGPRRGRSTSAIPAAGSCRSSAPTAA